MTGSESLTRVHAKAAIMACYNMMIPYLCPEMPAAQKEGLHYMVKTPLDLYQRGHHAIGAPGRSWGFPASMRRVATT